MHYNVDLLALLRERLEAGEVCEIEGQGPIPLSILKSLLPGTLGKLIIREGPEVRDVVHLGRQVTARQRAALRARDACCVVPGCSVRTGLEIDHVSGWQFTHRTELKDLVRLCKEHHRQKTFEGARLEGPVGHRRWVPPPARRRRREPG